jgi:NAD(P)-dependent dehydrogenase (short-subunit alcohol dehydrogenase family)
MAQLTGTTILITGANAGIGKAAAAALARRGARIGMLCRNAEKAARAREEIVEQAGHDEVLVVPLDLASFDSVRAAVETITSSFDEVSVLVNNAGLALSERKLTDDGHERTLQINHLGPMLLTELLLASDTHCPHRVVNVSSNAHRRAELDLDDLGLERGYHAWRQYCRSKLMNVYATRAWHRELSAKGASVTVNALHPGVVGTDITGDGDTSGLLKLGWAIARPFMKTPEQGASTTVFLAASDEVEDRSGLYFVDCGETEVSAQAKRDDVGERLMAISRAWIGLPASPDSP